MRCRHTFLRAWLRILYKGILPCCLCCFVSLISLSTFDHDIQAETQDFSFLVKEVAKYNLTTKLPTTCGGLHVVTAYCLESSHGGVNVQLATAHVAWVSDTPFRVDEAWCLSGPHLGTSLSTLHHKTECEVPAVTQDVIYIGTAAGILCSFQCVWRAPQKLSGVTVLTQVRNSANLKEWSTYHLGSESSFMNNLVVYDDCSNEPVEKQFSSAKLNIFVERLPDFCAHESRQFVAMQDFLFKFEAEWVLQMDDDCYFERSEPLLAALSDESVSKVVVSSAFYGACFSCSAPGLSRDLLSRVLELPNGMCALRERRPGESLPSFLGARQLPPATRLPWTLVDESQFIRGDLCFARGSSIVAGIGQTHDWVTSGQTTELHAASFHFKHVKLPPLKEYIAMVHADSMWGSIKPQSEVTSYWERLANYVCQEELEGFQIST